MAMSTARGLSLLVSLLLSICAVLVNGEECPKITPNWPSETEGTKSRLVVRNDSPLLVKVVWVDFEGQNSKDWIPEVIKPGKSDQYQTVTGHHFRIYGHLPRTSMVLLKEHSVQTEQDSVTVTGDCDDISSALEVESKQRDMEMERLLHDQQAPCLPLDDSTKWSCIKHLSKEEYDQRLKTYGTKKFGFNSTAEAVLRKVGDTVDHMWSSNIPLIPRLTNGPGFLKMGFTDRMREVLLPWYQKHKKGGPNDSVKPHKVIPGGFTNSHTVSMSIISMDDFGDIHELVSDEIQRILEWWTSQPLEPTATFGVRIYHRESMLINHVDRADTHLASAVIQVDQFGLEEGWPLEVLGEDGSCSEVYLQPGELVLYEGARFRHGRPMRFNGTGFANIFSHFRPLDWNGPNKSPLYDGLLDRHGYRQAGVLGDEL